MTCCEGFLKTHIDFQSLVSERKHYPNNISAKAEVDCSHLTM